MPDPPPSPLAGRPNCQVDGHGHDEDGAGDDDVYDDGAGDNEVYDDINDVVDSGAGVVVVEGSIKSCQLPCKMQLI